MAGEEREIPGKLVEIDEMPLVTVLSLDERDTVLANSLRRIAEAADQHDHDTIAAFQNMI